MSNSLEPELALMVVARASRVGLRPSEWLALTPAIDVQGESAGMDPAEWREAVLSTVEQYS